MSNPQQPELRRSEQTPSLTPDAIRGELVAHDRPESDGKSGPVPQANKPGSTSGPVQDKPDLDDFAAKLGISEDRTDDGDRDGQAQEDRGGVTLPKVLALAASAVGAAVGIVVVIRRRTASHREQIRKHLPV